MSDPSESTDAAAMHPPTIGPAEPVASARRQNDVGTRLGILLAITVLPQFVAIGAPAVALPDLGSSLHVGLGATAWVLASWSLTSAVAMPVAGRLVVRHGALAVLVAGLVVMSAGSVLAAVAPSLGVVVAGRLVGGAGAGAAQIAALALPGVLPTAPRLRALGAIAARAAPRRRPGRWSVGSSPRASDGGRSWPFLWWRSRFCSSWCWRGVEHFGQWQVGLHTATAFHRATSSGRLP